MGIPLEVSISVQPNVRLPFLCLVAWNLQRVYTCGSDLGKERPPRHIWVRAGHQAVLCGSGEGGVEVRHAVRPVRYADHHTGRHLL